MKKGPFEETARTIKYQNDWIRVEEASVIRPSGEKGIFRARPYEARQHRARP